MDFSWWVPWFVEWIHDIRFSVIWEETDFVTIRTPAFEWDFRCNISQWWKAIYLTKKDIDADLVSIFFQMKNYFDENFWEWIYTLDFWRTKDWNYKLIEWNSSPGLNLYIYDRKTEYKFFDAILSFLRKHWNHREKKY